MIIVESVVKQIKEMPNDAHAQGSSTKVCYIFQTQFISCFFHRTAAGTNRLLDLQIHFDV